MYPIDKLAFVVRLPHEDFVTIRQQALAVLFNIGKRVSPIDFGLTLSQQVKVRTVHDVDQLGHGWLLSNE